MVSSIPQFLRRSISTVALATGLIGCFAATSPASARIWFGFGFPGIYFGPPAYYPPAYPPPYYYPPPAYYPPAAYPAQQSYAPPASYAPQESPAPSATGQMCYAGSYTCPMDRPVTAGSACYCLGNGGTHEWGHAN